LAAADVSLPEQVVQSGQAHNLEPAATGATALALELASAREAAGALAYRHLAAVMPFHSVQDNITSEALAAAWAGGQEVKLLVDPQAAPVLAAIWGPPDETVAVGAVSAAALQEQGAVGVIGFEQLEPTLKVLRLDGVSVLSNQFDPAGDPLGVALLLQGPDELLAQFAPLADGWANRDASRLTQLVMTGVTAMCRLTAARMEANGLTYPAAIVGPELRLADITHVSNEVPFIKDCPVNTAAGTLVFCSDYRYWAALEALGTDIVGLSGNHVNDHGYAGARESLAYYESLGVPVYGSGVDLTAACKPLLWEDHGNTFAFIATLAYEPRSAWATAELPGACYYYDNKGAILATIAELSEQVDIVSVELQYLETYQPFPTAQQVVEFRELRAAGADLVTGVQSHVPQAWEPYGAADAGGPGMILYGLGNLFFDQMWSWPTRTGLIARHAIYKGRLLNTEMLTTVLEDYAQPRWTTPEERAELLASVHDAAPMPDTSPYGEPTGMAVYAVASALSHWLAGEPIQADYWGLSALTDDAFAPEPRGGKVTAARWRVVELLPGEGGKAQVRIEFSDVSCYLDGESYTYEGPLYTLATVTAQQDYYQVRELEPYTAAP
jgi:poly-gamma-glutamate synthesis protein (capsule biosynthesis protein)